MRDGPPKTFTMSIYTSDADIAPMYQDWTGMTVANPYSQKPTDKKALKVKKLVEFEADLSKIPLSDFETRCGQSGEGFYQQTCKIEMKLFSASSQFALIVKGKRYDTFTEEFME